MVAKHTPHFCTGEHMEKAMKRRERLCSPSSFVFAIPQLAAYDFREKKKKPLFFRTTGEKSSTREGGWQNSLGKKKEWRGVEGTFDMHGLTLYPALTDKVLPRSWNDLLFMSVNSQKYVLYIYCVCHIQRNLDNNYEN